MLRINAEVQTRIAAGEVPVTEPILLYCLKVSASKHMDRVVACEVQVLKSMSMNT